MRLPHKVDCAEVDIGIVGVPWDGGTRIRSGSREAPQTIRNKSTRIQMLHPVFRASPAEQCRVADLGDVTVSHSSQHETMGAIEAAYAALAAANVAPVSIGGDHLISLPILRGLARTRPLGLVHFDAHHDTAATSIYGEKYASSTPFRHAIEEGLVDPRRMIQIGIRGSVPTHEREEWARDAGVTIVTMDILHDRGLQYVIDLARETIGLAPSYVTFDIDGLDPAFAPGTGAPVIGGLTSYEALRILRGLHGRGIVGGDVNEVAPPYDVNDSTSLVAAALTYEILCLAAAAKTLQR